MADNCRNRIITQETRNKISKIHKGKTISEETKQKVSAVHKGKKLSEELIAAISIRSKKFNEERKKYLNDNLNKLKFKNKNIRKNTEIIIKLLLGGKTPDPGGGLNKKLIVAFHVHIEVQ